MSKTDMAEELVNVLRQPDSDPSLRPVHTIGVSAKGIFEPSRIARDYCIADHFNAEKTNVIVRFSNSLGTAKVHDGRSDVRGMAVRFHLSDGSDTDLISMTLPEFFAPTPETFLDFVRAAKPRPYRDESLSEKLWDLLRLMPPKRAPYPGETMSGRDGAIAFADKYGYPRLAMMHAALSGAPVSYARAAYHAVHTFIVTGPDASRRWVRFSWQPIAGVLKTDPQETPEDDYLRAELRDRLAKEPARFSLMMKLGEIGDDFDDPTIPWPPQRKRIMMGMLTLNTVPKDQTRECEKLSFNPGLLTKGIDLSGDRILKARVGAYKNSSNRRGGIPCPFSEG